jgi:flagellar basal body-associated protein FliL
MRAAAVEIIRAHTSTELLAEDGPSRLADELTEAGREIFGEHEIYSVIVTDLTVQA